MGFDGIRFSRCLTIAVALATVLAFAGLIPLGSWHDEYFAFMVQRHQGFAAALDRIGQWSPRPLSELAIYVYGVAVEHFHAPLIGRAIAPFWLLLAAGVLLPAWRRREGMLAATTLLAMLLLGHTVAEVFYWPFAVFAYLPTVTAAAALLALDWGGWLERRAGAVMVIAALLVAAASSEVGALFSVIYALLCAPMMRRSRPRFALLLMLPLLLGLVILYAEYTTRVALDAEVFGNPAIAHHPLRVLASLRETLLFQLLKGDDAGNVHRALNSGIATKLLFFAGIYLAMCEGSQPSSRGAQRLRLALAGTALLTAALVLAASLYNFGAPCCERHDTLRQVYVLVALGALASCLAGFRRVHAGRLAAPLLLLSSLLVPLWVAVPRLAHDYRNYTVSLDARRATWASGSAPGPHMQVVQVRPGLIVGGATFPPQVYTRQPTFAGLMDWILLYFDKQSATITAPSGRP